MRGIPTTTRNNTNGIKKAPNYYKNNLIIRIKHIHTQF
jgi:hypothetical protein